LLKKKRLGVRVEFVALRIVLAPLRAEKKRSLSVSLKFGLVLVPVSCGKKKIVSNVRSSGFKLS
jgi:hypothetical protein